MKIYIIDNYDSFTYNLVDLLYKLKITPIVIKNDEEKIDISDITHLIISPGPGTPEKSGFSIPLIKRYYKKIPTLGVCLGHQAIGKLFNCNIDYADNVMHGKVSLIYHNKKGIFKNIPSPFKAVRYHSLIIKNDRSFSKNLEITAWTEKDGKMDEIMAVQNKNYNLFGVQFHPESILTEYGDLLLKNFTSYDSPKLDLMVE